MGKDIVTKEEFTQLLYEVTDAYEREIKALKEENKQLELIVSGNVFWCMCKKMEYMLTWCCDMAVAGLKKVIVLLGCKEYLKGTKMYTFYKNRLGR